ncbi:MAG: M3 family oligoendopeptidase [Candidatus Eisenbacteria bacterium]|nr:M3 family oligoendopeptidase [Candidatus Eisenbacteria bacterium]
MPQTKESLPHWDLSNIYSGLEAEDFRGDLKKLQQMLDALDTAIEQHGIGRLDAPPRDIAAAARTLGELLERLNELLMLRSTLSAYVSGFYTTDSYNKVAARTISELEQLGVRIDRIMVRFEAWVGSLDTQLDSICSETPIAAEHRLVLDEMVEQSRYLMDSRLEDLASELMLSGGGAMWKLQGTVTSQLKMPFERDGQTETLPMTKIRNLAYDPDEAVRRRAFETEIRGWESIRESVAFAMNSVKGSAVTLAKWRGREDVLHQSLDQNRIDRETLRALMDAMKGSFPTFRRYLQSKAQKLGKEKLPWWDLFAPVGKVNPTYTWKELSNYVVTQFGAFSDELADFAHNAFEKKWIDAEPRDGKRGGAFCMRVPGVEESRILCNFDGSFDQLLTVSHELGHGFHNYCQKGLPVLKRGAPMTLAETASIFCETLVLNAALDAAEPEAQVGILENQLIGATQVIVDIYSRFLFESEVCRRRVNAEMSADDFCELMIESQKKTYGDGLDPDHLHPYLWLLKPHYYSGGLHFYNFPYAFGLLFGLGIYAIYRKEGEAFIPRYKELLRSTGAGKVADLAGSFGIDVRSTDFWKSSLGIVAEQVDRYCELEG